MNKFGPLVVAPLIAVAVLAAACNRFPEQPLRGAMIALPAFTTDFNTLYGVNCAGCHGADGNGNNEATASLARASNPSGKVSVPQAQGSAPVIVDDGKVHAKLVIERGNSAGKQFSLRHQDSNIGRWDADGGIFPDVDLDTDDPEAKVSRRHARISLRDGQYAIEDLGSTNGTFVNRGRRLKPGDQHPLKDGDEIIVGKTFLRFRIAK